MSAKLLDSTLVSLCMEIYDWALYTYTKGAMKLHTLLNFATFLPKNVYIINGKGSDNTSAREVKGPPHCIGLADRGYCDFGLLHDWDSIEVFFRISSRTSTQRVSWARHETLWKPRILLATGSHSSK